MRKITREYMDEAIKETLLGGRDELLIVNLLELNSISFDSDQMAICCKKC